MARFWQQREFWVDAIQAFGLLLQWLVVGIIIDQAGLDSWHKGATLYLAISTLTVNLVMFVRTFSVLGTPDAGDQHPETVFGLFLEVCSLAQGWGCAFAAARSWSLPDIDPYHAEPLLHKIGNSVFEMSLVQAGVGWAASAPYTLSERLVAWCAAYLGGILAVNIFLVSIVLGRRGWWSAVPT
jgi:hypothetical protein